MKVQTVKVCPACEEIVNTDNPLDTRYVCGECDEMHDEKDDAKECCKD